jgi:hypothetical protein
MSVSVGLGYSTTCENDFFEELRAIANNFNYGLLKGIKYSDPEIRDGLEISQQHQGWEHLLFLQSPKRDDEISLAFGIDEELTTFETAGIRPKFFDFLYELSQLCSLKCQNIDIFFASEWYKNDRIRYSYGNVENLISLLSMPGYWCIRYLIPETGRLQDSDETPFIFNLKFKSSNSGDY